MKTKLRLRTREELLALDDKYFGGGLGNLLSRGRRTSGDPTARLDPAPAAMLLLPGAKPWLPDMKRADGDLAFREFWCSKDTHSFAYRHDVDRLFAGARKPQKLSDHPVVNLQLRRRKMRESRCGRITLLGMKITEDAR